MAWYNSVRNFFKETFLTISTGGFYLVYKFGKAAYDMQKELKRIQELAKNVKSNTRDDVENLPYLKGASNSIATGKTQPYIIGTHLFTPYKLNRGFSKISGKNGEKQFYYVLLEGGFNNQVLGRIYCDDIVLRNFDGKTIQNGLFPFENNSTFASKDSLIEIKQDGTNFETDLFNKKIVEQNLSDQLKLSDDEDYKPLFYTLEQNSSAADVCIMFNGLLHYTDDGKKTDCERHIIPYYSLDYAQKVAEGVENPESVANWIPFQFSKIIHHEAEYLQKTAIYSYHYISYFPVFDKGKALKEAKENSYGWMYQSGDLLIKDSYDSIDCSIEKYTYNSRGGISGAYITIRLSKSVLSKPAYDEETKTTTFKEQISSQLRYNAHVDFSYNAVKDLNYPITLKLECTDKKATNGQDVSDCYVQWVQATCYDVKESKKQNKFVDERNIGKREAKQSTLIALKIESTKANEEKLKKIQVITSGVARTWDGADWSKTKKRTSNPASWLLEVMTSNKHNPSKIEDEEIDLDSFAKWYDFCEENNFSVNYVVTNGMQKSALMRLILETGRAALFRNPLTNLFTVAIDKKNDETNIPLLNEQDIISFSYEKEMTRKPNGLQVNFINAEKDYEKDSFIVMFDGSDPNERSNDSVLKDWELTGITSYDQAVREAYFRMKCANFRLKTAKATVGMEAIKWQPLQKVFVQHPTLKIGLGSSEIQTIVVNSQNKITGVILYDAIELDSENEYHCVIRSINGDEYKISTAKIKSKNGRFKEIEFEREVSSFVKAGDILSYGYSLESVISPMVVIGLSPNGNSFSVQLADYSDEVYKEDFEIPEYIPNITNKRTSSNQLPQTLPTPTMDDVIKLTESVTVGSKYTLDLSPEVQTIPVDSNGEKSVEWFYLSAYLYCMDVLCENVEYFAYIDGARVGFWDGNKVKISASYLKGDILEIEVKATFDGIQRSATATVSKLYAGADGDLTLYKMQFPDGEKIRCNASHENYEPKKLRVFKKKNTTEGEFDTNHGYITTEFVPNGTESRFETYAKVTGDFDSNEEYFGQYEPFLLKLDDETILGEEENGLVFFERTK